MAIVAWQLHVTTLYLATLLVNSPTLRPPGWGANSLAGVSKLSILVWGSFWLIFTFYIEYKLRESIRYQRLLRCSGIYGTILLIIYAIAYLLVL